MLKLENINIEEALRYMGCGPGGADDILMKKVNACRDELLKLIRPAYTYRLFEPEENAEGICLKGTSLVLTGDSIREHLSGCNSVVVMAATLSGYADSYIRRAEILDMADALIADSLCTAAIEQICDLAAEEIREKLPEGQFMTWRFSPGYGDLPLALQPQLLRVLNTEKLIGLTINDSLIMLPRKSVTAIIGLSDKPIEKKRRGCAACSMAETCQFRKRGVRCE